MSKNYFTNKFYLTNKLLALVALFLTSCILFACSGMGMSTGITLLQVPLWGLLSSVAIFLLMAYLLYRLNNGFKRLKLAEARSIISEEKYRNIIDSVSSAVFTPDESGYFSFSSKRAYQLTGYQDDEVLGMHFSELVDPEWKEMVFNNYFQQWMNAITETVYEFPIITKNGNRKWVEQCAVLMLENQKPIGFHCIVRDISDKKLIQTELEASELNRKHQQFQLQSILEHTTSIIYIKDLQGKYLVANKRFLEVLQVTNEQVIGHDDYHFSNQEQADYFSNLDQEVLRTRKPIEVEQVIEGKNGPINLLLVKFPLFDQHNNLFGISGIATDISERTQYQKELIAARQSAEHAKLLQEQFLANMSHEIRTPMNGIQGMTNLLLETVLDGQQKKYATIVKRSVNNLLVIINDILDFSKIQAGKLSIENIGFDVREVLQSIDAMFAHRLKKKQLELLFQIDSNVPDFLSGDPYRLNQILVNLVGNAIKFTESGRVTVGVQVVEQKNQAYLMRFSIKDTGIGIPADKIGSVFDSFAQAGSDVARKYGGTGLGLSISKQLIELQKGNIWVESILGEGSEFCFEIPYHEAAAETVTGLMRIHDMDFSKMLQGKKVLIAEDNYVNQVLIEHVLQNVGVITSIVSNGKEAIAQLKVKNDFDLILMDLQMPIMDGYKTTNFIRKQLEIKIPIIAMTATAMKGELEKCLEVGMTDYMSKPFEFVDLYKKLCQVLKINVVSDDQNETSLAAVENKVEKKLYDLSFLSRITKKNELIAILKPLIKNLNSETALMEIAMENGAWVELKALAHKIKGSVGFLKADELYQTLENIENASKDLDKKSIAADMNQVKTLSEEIIRHLKLEFSELNHELAVAC
jgi:PAS domain S-box-containing protein